MKRTLLGSSTALLGASALCGLCAAAGAQLTEEKFGPVVYGPPGVSLSSDGKVLFNAFAGDNVHAYEFVPDTPNGVGGTTSLLFVWTSGFYTLGSAASAFGAAGWREDPAFSTDHATVLESGLGPVSLPQLDPGPTYAPVSRAWAINDSGLVGGTSFYSSATTSEYHAVQWDLSSDGAVVDLNGPVPDPAFVLNQVNGINDFGDLCGAAVVGGTFHAFLMIAGSPATDLGTLIPGGWSIALGVDDFDDVVGYALGPGGTHVGWVAPGGAGPLIILPPLPGKTYSVARTIDMTMGDIVGWSQTSSGPGNWYTPSATATIWPAFTTTPVDVNTLGSFGADKFIAATGVNDAGQIAGEGIDAGSHFAYVLFPPGSPP